VGPAEDLMREHGVLDRVLLIYEDILARLGPAKDIDAATLRTAARIVRNFIENYHEKLEEEHLFPRFEKSGKLVDLVRVLREQHQAGRTLTDQIQQEAGLSSSYDSERTKLEAPIKAFIRLYRPHAAREDTVLFPAFRDLVTANEYDALGEEFEEEEHKLFGEEGFHEIVRQVTEIERRLRIEDLAQFMPRA
jgi:hemerythrin-like domain-containing protein